MLGKVRGERELALTQLGDELRLEGGDDAEGAADLPCLEGAEQGDGRREADPGRELPDHQELGGGNALLALRVEGDRLLLGAGRDFGEVHRHLDRGELARCQDEWERPFSELGAEAVAGVREALDGYGLVAVVLEDEGFLDVALAQYRGRAEAVGAADGLASFRQDKQGAVAGRSGGIARAAQSAPRCARASVRRAGCRPASSAEGGGGSEGGIGSEAFRVGAEAQAIGHFGGVLGQRGDLGRGWERGGLEGLGARGRDEGEGALWEAWV